MKRLIFLIVMVLPVFARAQSREVAITEVREWVRPTAPVGFSGKEGGRFLLTESPQSQRSNYLARLNSYTIFPNPSNGVFQLEGKFLPAMVEVYTAQGLLVSKIQPNRKALNTAEIQLVELKSGLYFLHAPGFVPQRIWVN